MLLDENSTAPEQLAASPIQFPLMTQARTSGKRTSNDIAAEIRSELRSILRLRRDLYAPLQRFERIADPANGTRYCVLFDMNPRKPIQGLKLGGLKQLKLPDEPIHDRVLEFAKAVWHLKDRLYQFAKATNQPADLNAMADESSHLLVTADLSNKKKHGCNDNRSKLNPHLDLVAFDTSKSGAIEFFYDGAMKDKELIVTSPLPIPFAVDILIQDDAVLGDAREIINKGLLEWLSVIQKLGILAGSDPATKALRMILLDADSSVE
ncbi:MAG: hypothetical protein JW888_16005 [Pirellulales bacterium]|nr:hypothetical protein [Pirellulales bacterium]